MKNIITYALFLMAPIFLIGQEVEEVIVTANKKAETVQEIPMNITVLSEALLDERGITSPEDYLRTLAGVSTPGGSNYFSFRGLNTSTSQRGSGTSSVFIDEVSGSLMSLFDVERVEILRGPQGTLYGSNAIGGTIRYVTNKPDSSSSYGKIRIGYGDKKRATDPRKTIEAMYNMPLTESIAARAVFSQIISPGIYKNIQTDKIVGEEDDTQFMLTFAYDDGGNLTGSFRYFKTNYETFGILEPGQSKPGSADVYVPGCTPSTSYYYGESCQRLGAIASEFGISDYNPQYAHASASDETEDDEMEMVQINLKYDFNIFDANLILTEKDFTANAYTDWARIDMDDLYIAPLVVENDTSEESFTELRISSKPGTIEWTIGYYNYEYEDNPGINQTQYAPNAEAFEYITDIIMGYPDFDGTVYCPPFCEGYTGYPYLYYASATDLSVQDETSYYAQVDYNLGEKLTFTFGIRDYELSDSYISSQYGVFFMDENGSDGTFPAGTSYAAESGEESDTRTKYAVSYKPDEDLTLYFTQATGYRPGGNQSPLPPFCESDETIGDTFSQRYNSDEAQTTEFGVKSRGSNYSANVTYFEVDWDKIIIRVTPGCGWGYNFNGGQAETKGWEVDFSYELTDSLSLDFAGSSMTAETSIDIESLGASAGDRLPNTVETQWNLGLVYDALILSYPSYARLDMSYYGDSFNTFAENPNTSSPDYTKLNLNIGMDLSEVSKLQLTIDNLTDERTEAYIYAVDDTGYRPRNWMQWIPPRTVTIKYSYSF